MAQTILIFEGFNIEKGEEARIKPFGGGGVLPKFKCIASVLESYFSKLKLVCTVAALYIYLNCTETSL